MARLRLLAGRFREVLAQYCAEDFSGQWNRFPAGKCGDTSEMLAKYLGDQGMGEFRYICGWRGTGCDSYSHAWLEQDGVIIDITADQFENQDQAVIVTLDSWWHQLFEREIDHQALWTDVPAELMMTYRILTQLDAGVDLREPLQQETLQQTWKDHQ